MKTYKALKISQPLAEFFLTAIPARVLLDVCAIHPYKRMAVYQDGNVDDVGNQRRLSEQRVKSVASFLKTQGAVLPGTLILAANFDERGKFYPAMCSDDEGDGGQDSERWIAKMVEGVDGVYDLVIPNEGRKLAALVDGQHRLMGFENQEDCIADMMLPCAVFLDLPVQEQAYVFATINFNQKPVSKSHTYELYGISLADEPERSWTPEKLAVNFSRRFNADPESPFMGHIKVAAMDCCEEFNNSDWLVSTATIVEGVMSLITRCPQEDRNEMCGVPASKRLRTILQCDDRLPLRDFYRMGDCDELLYKIIRNYFNAAFNLLGIKNDQSSIFRRTAGVQALFCVLKVILQDRSFFNEKKFTIEKWEEKFSSAKTINFSGFGVSSGSDRALIRDAILVAIGMKKIEEVRNEDKRNKIFTAMVRKSEEV